VRRQEFTEQARRIGITVWTAIGILVLGGMLFWLMAQASVIVIPVVFAMVIVYILNPIVRRLSNRGIPRAVGTVIAYLVAAAVLLLVVVFTFPAIREQALQLVEQLPAIYDDVVALVERTLGLVGVDVNVPTFDEIADFIGDADADLQATLQELLTAAFDIALSVFEAIALFLVAPVIAFYILVDLPRVGTTAVDLMPEDARAETLHVAERLGRALGGFVRGQLLAATFVAVLSAIGYRLIGLELWLIIAIIAGLFNMIPFVGPWIAGILAVGVALVSGDLTTVVLAAVVALVVQQLDNHFVSPLVLRATVKLHPALIILALLVGGSIGGLLGIILAVPVLAVAKVLASHFWRTRVLGEPWEKAVESIVYEPDPSTTAEMLAVRLRRKQAEPADDDVTPGE
jgi:predicted PurR-regulated permease PerM